MGCLSITTRIANKCIKEMLFVNKENTMADNYAIVRHQKRRGPEMINGIWAENIRSILGKNVDDNRSHLNITVTPLAFDNYDHFVAIRGEQIQVANKQRKANEKQARMRCVTKDMKTGKSKHLALMQEFVFTHSNGAMGIDESIRYCTLAHKFIMNWFDTWNIISSIIHLDETTPHIHIWTDYYDKFDNRFNQSVLQDKGKTDINAIRYAWQKMLIEEGFDLLKQDGSVVGAEHDGSKADKNKGDLKKQIVDLTENLKSLQESKFVLKNENDDFKKENIALVASSKEKDVLIQEFKSEISKLSKTLSYLKQKLQPWYKYIKDTFDMDILKEVPPAVVKQESQIESTLQNDTVNDGIPGIPSLIN